MSFSLIENKDAEKYFIKLQIHEINAVQNMNIPLPYGICISLNNKQEKYLEPINNENELFDNNKNIFVFYLDKNHLNDINATEKEIIINSYTTSIFILKKNFASVKIQIQLNHDLNQKKNWYFLKDINNNICIKILISIFINIPRIKTIKENKFEITNSILYKINETIKENKIKNMSRSNTNYILNNHNTHLISTNYNSSQGNSLLNLTNNIYNINNNNLNITFPINYSPITLIGKSNSFFIDSKNKQLENNMKIINNNLLFKNNLNTKNESNSLKDNEDSLIINNDNAFIDEENNNNEEEENIESKINKLIKLKNKEIENKESIYKKYSKNYNDNIKKEQKLNKNNKQFIKQIVNLKKTKEKNRTELNLMENINSLKKDKYRQEIQNELNNYEKFIFQNLNHITNINNNLEQTLMNKNLIQNEKNKHKEIITPRKAESFNKIDIYGQNYNKNKKSIFCQNKTIPHNPMYIKKLNFINKKGKIGNYINSGRLLNNKKYTPINYKFKNFNRKLSTSTSNISISENIKNESKNKILKTEGKNNTNTKSLNNDSNNNGKFKKIDKINIKRKSLKIQGNIHIPFYEISNKKKFQSRSNYQTKYSFAKINLNKEILSTKNNSTIASNKKNLDKTINKNTILKSKKIEKDINLTEQSNYFHKISNISLDKNIFAIENISPNNYKVNKTTFNNNFGKKKLKLLDKSNINNNNKKSLNMDNFKVFNSHNNSKGNPLFIKCNNNKQNLTIKNNTFRLNTNPNECNKKKNIKFRNNLNLSGNILLLNIQKPNKSTRENKKKISS